MQSRQSGHLLCTWPKVKHDASTTIHRSHALTLMMLPPATRTNDADFWSKIGGQRIIRRQPSFSNPRWHPSQESCTPMNETDWDLMAISASGRSSVWPVQKDRRLEDDRDIFNQTTKAFAGAAWDGAENVLKMSAAQATHSSQRPLWGRPAGSARAWSGAY